MKKLDTGILLGTIVILFVISFFWGCRFDWIITLVILLIMAGMTVVSYFQTKKIKELNNKEE